MAHTEQRVFIEKVKSFYPEFFNNVSVLEVGSLNINGTVRDFFSNTTMYIGLDLMEGPEVDLVCPGKDFKHESIFDTVISTECFEHDKDWIKTFLNMIENTRENGLVIFTCASNGRHEHGTKRTSPQDSPATTDYYRNLNENDFREALSLEGTQIEELFSKSAFEYNPVTCDLYFWGVKK